MVDFRITETSPMHSQPPKSPLSGGLDSYPPNSPDKGTPPDKGAGGLGDLLPLSFPSYQRGSGGLWKLR